MGVVACPSLIAVDGWTHFPRGCAATALRAFCATLRDDTWDCRKPRKGPTGWGGGGVRGLEGKKQACKLTGVQGWVWVWELRDHQGRGTKDKQQPRRCTVLISPDLMLACTALRPLPYCCSSLLATCVWAQGAHGRLLT